MPEPTIDAAHGREGAEALVRMNAYGGMKLAYVQAATGLLDTKGTYKFLRWVPRDEEAESLARGELQLNGVPQIDPGKLDGHLPEPPKAAE